MIDGPFKLDSWCSSHAPVLCSRAGAVNKKGKKIGLTLSPVRLRLAVSNFRRNSQRSGKQDERYQQTKWFRSFHIKATDPTFSPFQTLDKSIQVFPIIGSHRHFFPKVGTFHKKSSKVWKIISSFFQPLEVKNINL